MLGSGRYGTGFRNPSGVRDQAQNHLSTALSKLLNDKLRPKLLYCLRLFAVTLLFLLETHSTPQEIAETSLR